MGAGGGARRHGSSLGCGLFLHGRRWRAAAGGVGGGGVGFGYGWWLVVGGSEEQWSFLVSLLRGSLWELVGMCTILRGQAS